MTTYVLKSSGNINLSNLVLDAPLGFASGGLGTSCANASAARTALGVAIGSDVQAYDSKLSTLAGLSGDNGKVVGWNGSDFVLRDDSDVSYTADASTLQLTGSQFSIKASGVDTTQVKDAAITADKLASDAVSTVKLADSAVSTAKLADKAITSDKLASDAVSTVKLADSAVTTAKLDASAVTNDKLASSAVKFANLNTTDILGSGLTTDTGKIVLASNVLRNFGNFAIDGDMTFNQGISAKNGVYLNQQAFINGAQFSTSNATQQTIYSCIIPANFNAWVEADVVCASSDLSVYAKFKVEGMASYNGTSTVSNAINSSYLCKSDSGLDCVMAVSGNSLVVKITGLASKNLQWSCVFKQIKNPAPSS